MESHLELESEGEVTFNQSSVRTIEIKRELEDFKQVIGDTSFQTPFQQLRNQNKENAKLKIIQRQAQEHSRVVDLKKHLKPGPDLYKLLSENCEKVKIRLKIPETLMFTKIGDNPSYIFTGRQGYIKLLHSEKSAKSFFKSTKKRRDPRFPSYIHIAMESKITLCFSEEEAWKVYSECPYYEHRLHEFISPHTPFLSKHRVQWLLNKPATIYTLTNKQGVKSKSEVPEIEKTASKATLSSMTKTIFSNKERTSFLSSIRLDSPSIIRKPRASLANFPEEKKEIELKTRSQSVNFLQLQPSPISKKKSYDIITIHNIAHGKPESFLVEFSNKNSNLITSSQNIPDIDIMLKSVHELIKGFFLLQKKSPLEEFMVDLMKNSSNEWVIISIIGYNLNSKTKKVAKCRIDPRVNAEKSIHELPVLRNSSYQPSIPIEPTNTFNELDPMDESIELKQIYDSIIYRSSFLRTPKHLKVDKKNIQQEIVKNYMLERSGDSLGRVPFNMISILPKKVDRPIRIFIEKKREPLLKPTKHKDRLKSLVWAGSQKPFRFIEHTNKYMEDINRHFDKRIRAAREGKQYIKETVELIDLINSKYEQVLTACKNCFFRLSNHRFLRYHFENRTIHEIEGICNSFFMVLKPGTKIGIRHDLKRSHKYLKITTEEFRRFCLLLRESFLAEGFHEKEINAVEARVRQFETEIVRIKNHMHEPSSEEIND